MWITISAGRSWNGEIERWLILMATGEMGREDVAKKDRKDLESFKTASIP